MVLFSAHRLIMVYICTNFHENILNGIRVMELWSGHEKLTDGQTDVRTDGRRTRQYTTRLRRAYKYDRVAAPEGVILTLTLP